MMAMAVDRSHQLAEFAEVTDELATRFDEAGDRLGQQFAAVHRAALGLLRDGFDQRQLTELTRNFPSSPDWLNPKALDAGLRQEPWQEAIVPTWIRARSLALELRTIGTTE